MGWNNADRVSYLQTAEATRAQKKQRALYLQYQVFAIRQTRKAKNNPISATCASAGRSWCRRVAY